MKTKNILSLSALSAVMLTAVVAITGCHRVEEPHYEVSNVKTSFTTAIDKGSANTMASGVRDAQFQADDTIGIYAVANLKPDAEGVLEVNGNYADNVLSIFDGTKWVNTPEIYFPSVKLNFYAYAPYNASFSPTATPATYKFTVAADQSTAAKIYACDFMTALTEGVTTTVDPVAMKFYHRMAKADVKFKFPAKYQGKDIKKVNKVMLHGFKNVASVDLLTKYTYLVDGTATGGTYPKPAIADTASTVVDITPNLASGDAAAPTTEVIYEAIVVPQSQPKGYNFVEIELMYTDGKTEAFFYKYNDADATIDFYAGRTTQINVSFLADNKLVLDDVTIKGWDTSLPPNNGNVTEKEVFNKFDCTAPTAPSYKVTKVEMTVTQGTGTPTTKVYTIPAVHTAGQVAFSFSFDGTCASPEYYPFKITEIKLIGAGAGEESTWTLTTPKEIKAVGTVVVTN